MRGLADVIKGCLCGVGQLPAPHLNLYLVLLWLRVPKMQLPPPLPHLWKCTNNRFLLVREIPREGIAQNGIPTVLTVSGCDAMRPVDKSLT